MSKKMLETKTVVRDLPEAHGSVLLFMRERAYVETYAYGALVRTGDNDWIGTMEGSYLSNVIVQDLIKTGTNVGDKGGNGYWIEIDKQEATS